MGAALWPMAAYQLGCFWKFDEIHRLSMFHAKPRMLAVCTLGCLDSCCWSMESTGIGDRLDGFAL
jgi:hypothetical protein